MKKHSSFVVKKTPRSVFCNFRILFGVMFEVCLEHFGSTWRAAGPKRFLASCFVTFGSMWVLFSALFNPFWNIEDVICSLLLSVSVIGERLLWDFSLCDPVCWLDVGRWGEGEGEGKKEKEKKFMYSLKTKALRLLIIINL